MDGDTGQVLIVRPNLDDPDGVYERLAAAHRDLDPAASAALNARLVLLLANHAGSRAVVEQALGLALPDRGQVPVA